ncbi:hypothetical protein ACSU6B_23350 [Neobacillus sp. C211]|uniref:hypothetical protein n=1 Tax=unclassified Neobacillus TaxID=2675272 RepID=UPI00397E7B8D
MMERPEFKKETIAKLGRGFRFYKMMVNAKDIKISSDHIKDYFKQFFKDAMADILQKDDNFKKLQELENELMERITAYDATLKEMETLAGIQLMFLHHLEDSLSWKLRAELMQSITMIENEIREEIMTIPDKKVADYARRQAENLFALEDLVMKEVARSFKEKGMEGMVIGIGLHGGLKRFDI